MTLIKKAPSLKDPNLDRNMKHTTPNEIMDTTRRRKQKKYRIPSQKQFMTYAPGQYEEIFKKDKE